MPQSLSKILLHVVFSIKNRETFIKKELQADLHAYIAGVCRKNRSEAWRVGGTEDHVHIACSLPRTLTTAKLVEEIKKTSSRWVKAHEFGDKDFAWQSGYGAFSLGQSQLQDLIEYIEKQREHHVKRTFKDEFIDILNKYGIEYDERHVWD